MSDIDLVCDMCGEELAQSELKRYGKRFVIEVTPCPNCYVQVPEETEEDEAEIIYNKMFGHYYSPNNTIFDSDSGWIMETAPKKAVDVKSRIGELIDAGHKVKAGWAATSVRGFHHFIIFYKRARNAEKSGS